MLSDFRSHGCKRRENKIPPSAIRNLMDEVRWWSSRNIPTIPTKKKTLANINARKLRASSQPSRVAAPPLVPPNLHQNLSGMTSKHTAYVDIAEPSSLLRKAAALSSSDVSICGKREGERCCLKMLYQLSASRRNVSCEQTPHLKIGL